MIFLKYQNLPRSSNFRNQKVAVSRQNVQKYRKVKILTFKLTFSKVPKMFEYLMLKINKTLLLTKTPVHTNFYFFDLRLIHRWQKNLLVKNKSFHQDPSHKKTIKRDTDFCYAMLHSQLSFVTYPMRLCMDMSSPPSPLLLCYLFWQIMFTNTSSSLVCFIHS